MNWLSSTFLWLITSSATAQSTEQGQLNELIAAIRDVSATSYLEQLYWLSQTLILPVIIIAAGLAYVQIRTTKLLELTKFLDEPKLREARRIVRREISEVTDVTQKWWQTNAEWEGAASAVCSSYDVVGNSLMSSFVDRSCGPIGVTDDFLRQWGHSVVNTYEILKPFVEDRRNQKSRYKRSKYYDGYVWLYEYAKKTSP